MTEILLWMMGGLGFLVSVSVYCALKLAKETDRITSGIEDN